MISHVRQNVDNQVISSIEARYGALTMSRGTEHSDVGMKIDCTHTGEVKLTMRGHINKASKDFSVVCDIGARTPAADHLFEVNLQESLLPEKKKKSFIR